LRDRQLKHAEPADQHDDDGKDRGEDGPANEEMGEVHGATHFAAVACCGDSQGFGSTSIPGRTRNNPSTIICSPGLSPSFTTRSPSIIGPIVTGRNSTCFSAFTT